MGILPDWLIQRDIKIEPFAEGSLRPGVISYGVSSYGYDVRVGRHFVFRTEIDHGDARSAAPFRDGRAIDYRVAGADHDDIVFDFCSPFCIPIFQPFQVVSWGFSPFFHRREAVH